MEEGRDPRHSINKKYASGENFLRKSLWASRSKVADGDEKESNERILKMMVFYEMKESRLNAKDNENKFLILFQALYLSTSLKREHKHIHYDKVISSFDSHVLMRKVESLMKAQEVELSRWYAMHRPPCQFREYFMTLKGWILQRSRLQLLSQPFVKIQQEGDFFRSNKRCYKISIGMAESAPVYEQWFGIAGTEHYWREGTEQYKSIEHCLAYVDR
ncbi:hypothetical protein Tco_1134533 [Tanacetum coccineum]